MEPLGKTSIIALVIISSAVSSLLFIEGTHIYASELVTYVLYFPFYVVFEITFLVASAGIYIPLPYVFLIGTIFSAACLFFLIRKFPSLSCAGIGVIFFLFLVIVGQGVFVKTIYLPHVTGIVTLLTSLRVLLEFLIGLAVIYVLLEPIDLSTISLRDNLFKKGSERKK